MRLPVFLRRALCVLLALLLCAAPGARCESEPRWHAGFGQREIPLPENAGPLYIAGYRNGYEITGVLDLPRATAVWLDCGGAGVLLIGVDCVGLSRAYVEQLRASLAVECREWNCAQVNVYATHTHAGVDTMGLWGKVGRDGKNEAFMQNLLQAARSAALDAYADRRAGTLSYGKAATAGMQRDSRLPYEYDPYIHHLKFAPDDGGAGFRIVNYCAHAESLRGQNTLLSRDFPGVMADVLLERTGERMLFMPGAIGGLVMTQEFEKNADGSLNAEKNLETTGRMLAGALLRVSDDRPLAAELEIARTELTVPLDNTAFLLARMLGILNARAVPGAGATGYALESELSVLRLGNMYLALIPGELFPELVTGRYLSASIAAAPERENPEPLAAIMTRRGLSADSLLICGLANDELGYIVPPNDFLLHPDTPYFANACDSAGRRHYEETNSVGPETANVIAAGFERCLSQLFPGG